MLKLSAAYAMAITCNAELLDTDTHKLTLEFSQSKSRWGFQNPQPVVLESRMAQTVQVFPSWDLFIKHKKKEWAEEIQAEYDVFSSRATIKQTVALIGYVLSCKITLNESFCSLAYSIVSCALNNWKEIYEDAAWKNSLREVQVMLSWTPIIANSSGPGLENSDIARVPVSSLFSALLNLSRAFTRVNLSSAMVDTVKLVFMKSHTYRSSLLDIHKNVVRSCEQLLQVTDMKDLMKSSRWFREMGDQKKRTILLTVGFREFIKEEGVADSVLLANYIKTLVRKVQFGLIPEPIQNLLLYLLGGGSASREIAATPKAESEDTVTKQVADCVYAVLSISKDRLDLVKSIIKVAQRIFKESTTDVISPSSLASIIQVTSDELPPGLDQDQIKKRLIKWHEVFSRLLSSPNTFHLID